MRVLRLPCGASRIDGGILSWKLSRCGTTRAPTDSSHRLKASCRKLSAVPSWMYSTYGASDGALSSADVSVARIRSRNAPPRVAFASGGCVMQVNQAMVGAGRAVCGALPPTKGGGSHHEHLEQSETERFADARAQAHLSGCRQKVRSSPTG